MENKLQIFNNPQFGDIRVAGTNEQPLFCLADVCKILDLNNTSQVKTRLNDGVISNDVILDSLGRSQQVTFINEDGLYDVILDSRKPEAKAFRKWVTSEVLPSIRKNGMYATDITIDKMISDPDFAIKLLTNLKDERQKRIAAEQTIKEQAPKALFADAVATSNRSCLIAELAKLIKQNGYEIGQNRLFEWMRKNGYLCSKGEYYNQPTQRSMQQGLFEVKKTAISKPDGSVLVTCTTKCTGKGQIYFINKFLSV